MSSRVDRLHESRMKELIKQAAEQLDASVRQRCEYCGRGAAKMALPTLEDLEAIMEIRDGFDGLRKDFSPLIADRFRRLDNTINYLHVMIAGSK